MAPRLKQTWRHSEGEGCFVNRDLGTRQSKQVLDKQQSVVSSDGHGKVMDLQHCWSALSQGGKNGAHQERRHAQSAPQPKTRGWGNGYQQRSPVQPARGVMNCSALLPKSGGWGNGYQQRSPIRPAHGLMSERDLLPAHAQRPVSKQLPRSSSGILTARDLTTNSQPKTVSALYHCCFAFPCVVLCCSLLLRGIIHCIVTNIVRLPGHGVEWRVY